MATRKKKAVVKGKKAARPAAKAKKPARKPAKKPAPTRRRPPMHAKLDALDLSDKDTGSDETFEVFKSFDRDGSGSIDRGEFSRLLEALGMELDEDELEVAVDMVDSNASGRISWAEFQAWWSDR